jgi:hypothetical protein
MNREEFYGKKVGVEKDPAIMRREILEKDRQSTRSALKTAEETKAIGVASSAALSEQGEKLRKINGKMDEIELKMTESNYLIRGISSVWGFVANSITGKNNMEEKTTTIPQTTKTRTTLSKASDPMLSGHTRSMSDVVPQHSTAPIGLSEEEKKLWDESESDLEGLLSITKDLKNLAVEMDKELTQHQQLTETALLKANKLDSHIKNNTHKIKKLM